MTGVRNPCRVRRRMRLLLSCCLALGPWAFAAAEDLPEPTVLRAWVEEMKRAERGPFARIRWFCRDGQVLPPEPSACREHGGGEQHGEWTERVQRLRAGGYHIATVYADLDLEALLAGPDPGEAFEQMQIEQFLIAADEGWILRKARYYRGAFQVESERRGAQRLLERLALEPRWAGPEFPVLRIGVGLLPHGADSAPVRAVRQLATDLAEQDSTFQALRTKLHGRLEPADAAAVRAHGAGTSAEAQFEALAEAIDRVFTPAPLAPALAALARRLAEQGLASATVFEALAARLDGPEPLARLQATAELMAAAREHLERLPSGRDRLRLLELSLAAEADYFATAGRVSRGADQASRRELIEWLRTGVTAAYGAGLLSARQRQALEPALAGLLEDAVPLERYKRALEDAARVPDWAGRRLRYHYGETVDRLRPLEPLAEQFLPDQLRGGTLAFHAAVVDRLLRDANALAGVRNELFGEDIGAGLRALNPGLARGVLLAAGPDTPAGAWRAEGIYLLPETLADLPPIAGILTGAEGNPLSHVQLLARNLGIPNVAVDAGPMQRLRAAVGRPVVLAVSAAGSVRLAEDGPAWDAVFGAEPRVAEGRIAPQADRLELTAVDPVPLRALSAADAGRIVGPKAARLGQLARHYPESVAPGLAIPFGAFRTLLERPMPGTGLTVFEWMRREYRALEQLAQGSAERARGTEALRARLAAWVSAQDPGEAFRARLREAMAAEFGPEAGYGVFVRSDTNVEDLPGFTGAGLNLTVPNVVGFEQVVQAITRVWASPFSARAFAWRQARMEAPEHVYPSVLLMRSVPSEKSGVLVTRDLESGDPGWLSIALNEGVGGAVEGQAAESLRVRLDTGEVRLLAEASAPRRRLLDPAGGLREEPASGASAVLAPAELDALLRLARELPQRYPPLLEASGRPAPADVEFAFVDGRLQLFQIRPFLDSARARASDYLAGLDRDLAGRLREVRVSMDAVAGGRP